MKGDHKAKFSFEELEQRQETGCVIFLFLGYPIVIC